MHPTVIDRFDMQVVRTPAAIALTDGLHTLTYRALRDRADALAARLQERGVGRDSIVPLIAARSLEALVAILAILKAGGACLPVDPAWPAERIAWVLEDCGARLALSDIPQPGVETIPLDASSPVPLRRLHDRRSLAYAIYTSGSTGKPKGVELEHEVLEGLIEWHAHHLPHREEERVLQFSALCFDVCFQEVFATWCAGATLVLPDEASRRDPARLLAFLKAQEVERIYLPFVALQQLSEAARRTPDAELPRLRDIITAGEQLRATPALQDFVRRMAGCRLHNHYGPSETHVVTAFTLPDDPAEWSELPPIGKALDHATVLVLDVRGKEADYGEIHIGGRCLARGYLNRPQLTAEKFVTHPLHGRLYRSGDLGRRNEDGSLDFLGRADRQVKIRGFRVEPGEIENVVSRHAAVAECVVVPNGERLVLYVVARPGEVAGDLRPWLAGLLPEYMVPTLQVDLERFPLTATGKIDRKSLPAPPAARPSISTPHVGPASETEATITATFDEVLGLAGVGVLDNFFELGGQSLQLVRLHARLVERVGLKVDVTDLFDHPTPRAIAQLLSPRIPRNGASRGAAQRAALAARSASMVGGR